MAKDPAFLFYPGDASDDTQFMNRLERGCYFDILKAQKKFVKFTFDQLKKVLGNDFNSCWPALELVLKKDGDFYFIEWVAEKIEERKKFSESRSKNRKSKTLDTEVSITSQSLDSHMVVVDEIENESVFEENYKRAFDEIYLDQLATKYKGINISKELSDFRFKCDSAPTEYHCRDRDGLRLGFLAQLKNGNGINGSKEKIKHELK